MKRNWILLVVALVALLAFAACNRNDGTDGGVGGAAADGGGAAASDGGGAAVADGGAAGGRQTINVWAFTDEVPNMINRYLELNPDFASRYQINATIIATDGGGYQPALDTALASGGSNAPDLFMAESAFVVRNTQGDMSRFAMSYSELGIENLEQRIADAQIAQYIVDLGSRDGEVVGLAFQMTGGAVIYRRSIAQAVWGNDDPEFVRTRIGPGWGRFMEAAAEMDAAGFSMVSGAGDIWQAVRNTGGSWVVNGALDIHPDRMAMFDHARILYENGWMNDANGWSEAWFADMSDSGVRPVFAFLGPAWLINYVMAGNANETYGDWAIAVPPVGFTWGGTWLIPNAGMNPDVRDGVREIVEWITLDTSENGLQHHWANGTLFGEGGTKDAVASAVVMAGADGTLDFLGGQDMFDVFIPAGQYADGTLFTQYDEDMNQWFMDHSMYYARGDMTREESIASFRLNVSENLGIN